MLKFWRNPEFVRYARAELRAPRAITAGLLALVVCALTGLACWASEPEKAQAFVKLYHASLVGIQFTFAASWAVSTCGQAISRERELKTFDFLRTTRLTSTEIMIGKLIGVPVLAYFVVACTLPVSFLVGIVAGYGPVTLFKVYVLLVALTLFVSLVGLTISMLLEKSVSVALALIILWPLTLLYSFAMSPFPGLGALSILPAIFELYSLDAGSDLHRATIFGLETSYFVTTLILYTAFGAWMMVMLKRNLKKDPEQIRLLSRWGAVGFGGFLNVLFYAFLDPAMVSLKKDYKLIEPETISLLAVGYNGLLLLLLGITMLVPHERLKVWWRRRKAGEEGWYSESSLPFPWMVAAAAVAYALLVAEAAGLAGTFGIRDWRLDRAAVQMLVVGVFAIRDVQFLQWCNLTRMKRPILTGILYLSLYYVAASVIAAVVHVAREASGSYVFELTTPFGVFGDKSSPLIFAGLILQAVAIFLILKFTETRISRPAQVGVTANA